MKKKLSFLWAVVFFLSTPILVEAQSSPKRMYEKPVYIFLGIDLGYSHYGPYNSSVAEAPRGGSDLGFRGLFAYYWPEWVLDGGVGIQWINNSGTNIDNSINTDKTTNAYVDLSPRYRLTRNWQIGPEFQYWLSTDKGLNPPAAGTLLNSNAENTSIWGGLQGLYEWGNGTKYRLGARALTAFNVDSRFVWVGQVFFQVGLNIFGGDGQTNDAPKLIERINEDDLSRVEDRSNHDPLVMTPEPTPYQSLAGTEPEVMTTPAPPEPEATPTPKPVPPKAVPKIVMTLDVNDLPFGYNNADLPPAKAARVVKIGEFLQKNNGTWKSLRVGGHTDERGSVQYNMELSKRRARTVRELLVNGGADAKKIKAFGYGKKHPIAKGHNEKAWAKNRRVELDFRGVKDVVLMKRALNQ